MLTGTMSLTSGCIQRIYNQDSDVSAAVVQVLDVKKLGAQGGTGAPRYRWPRVATTSREEGGS